MGTDDKEAKKSEISPVASEGGLISSDNFDNFFDDFLTRRWPLPFDWNYPAGGTLEKHFPKVDIIDHDNELEVQAALPDYVDYDNAKATFKDGILKVTIPKSEKGKRKSIEFRLRIF